MTSRSGGRVLLVIPECLAPPSITRTPRRVTMTQVRHGDIICHDHGALYLCFSRPVCVSHPRIIFSLTPCCAEDDEAGDDRKKRPRTAFTAAQIKALESEFEKNKYLSVSKRMQLSKQLKLTETQV